MCVCVCVYVCTCVYMYICMYVYKYALCVCMYVCVCIRSYSQAISHQPHISAALTSRYQLILITILTNL